VDRCRDRLDAILRQHDDPCVVALRVGDQFAGDGIELGDAHFDLGIVGPETLQVVIEMRKVDQRQSRRAGAADMQCRFGNPPRRGD
jgi:hypothetical protein